MLGLNVSRFIVAAFSVCINCLCNWGQQGGKFCAKAAFGFVLQENRRGNIISIQDDCCRRSILSINQEDDQLTDASSTGVHRRKQIERLDHRISGRLDIFRHLGDGTATRLITTRIGCFPAFISYLRFEYRRSEYSCEGQNHGLRRK